MEQSHHDRVKDTLKKGANWTVAGVLKYCYYLIFSPRGRATEGGRSMTNPSSRTILVLKVTGY